MQILENPIGLCHVCHLTEIGASGILCGKTSWFW